MRVALVLGSGGARGYAHIGVIAEILARDHEIVGVSGSSMGALVGGLHAAGRLAEYAEWAGSLTQRAMLRLLDPSLTAAGVLRAEKILEAVRDIAGDVDVEDLPVPFTSVATDMLAGRSVWIQRGPLHDAIRASIAIPGVIAPHVLDGRLLADGGILEPIPIGPVAALDADAVIAVSLSGEDPAARPGERLGRRWRATSALLDTKAAKTVLDTPSGRAMFGRFVDDVDDDETAPRLGGFEVMNRTIDIAQGALARHALAAYPVDLLIEIPRTVCRSLEFHRAVEVIGVGRAVARQALEDWEEV
ncbi:patatin-like phospholipase family protein [Tsukamurella sp. 8F]|uniref:patatin-like phospholipase family protein n=1 Tax=unclassified Tsukamurella TaxID=2633480 RepID=UPI0023B9BF56|nr:MULTISPECIES: patatin-like phospholipase family protein [unclassified Tsukamurella]MDF0528995.1 patatin-like phospholipase family protein [Tsukamurella sp. 8J]MDF0587368.1 patatin-like phospholipase family protein [Tsukamurella sp. 8F]